MYSHSKPSGLSIVTVALILGLATHLAASMPYIPMRARHVANVADLRESYDYIIVGGGTAGLTVADRLTEDGEYTVLVIEHGYFYDANDVLGGGRQAAQYNLTSVPQPMLGNKTAPVDIGHCVGGSSAINGMAVMRGTAEEYNIWAELGGEGSTWDWDGMLPYFKKAMHFMPPDAALAADFHISYDIESAWGQYEDTRVYASYPGSYMSPQLLTIYNAMSVMPGVDVPADGHAGTHGLFYYPVSVDPRSMTRSYSRTGHWDNLNRTNYEIITGSRADEILFDGSIANGVAFVPKDGNVTTATTVKATKEVIIAAGTIHTPQLLQLSGIGPADLLEQANIPVKVDLPGVGSNFQDHPLGPSVAYRWGTTPPSPINSTGGFGGFGPGTRFPPMTQGLGAFLSLPVVSPDNYDAIAAKYESQDLADYVPETTAESVLAGYKLQQEIYAREMRSEEVSFLNQLIGGTPGAMPIGLHVTSRGTVRIDPMHPEAEPLVDYAALTNPVDMDLMIAYVRFVRRFMESEPFAPYNATEVYPGASVTSDDDLASWIRGVYTPRGYHPIGTASKMPRELGGVVDEGLLVHGTERLSVVDASIMPTLIGGTTQLTVYAIAEKAAALIKSRQ
ncbi:hypothetical protein BDY21DRAFT_324656 [Lineolata rhizophorae]|uniref:Glucose-methanol-choline oxidoreductase N-terminal domain-containing protein n=1 Tax=Lineolata rhizophorae TaxID=578093 RepID=A0A6A6NUC5_9PEZI|nr:hypothetical protein BDY21DRAFT_324656 [Lineolata rhizophorae]